MNPRARAANGLASVVALAVAAAPLPTLAQAPAGAPSPERRPLEPMTEPPGLTPPGLGAREAERLAAVGRHAEAAGVYEAQLSVDGDPRHLYRAGVERSLAGQHALALQHFTRYLERAGGVDDATRRHVQARLAESRARTVAVTLQVVDIGGAAVDVGSARVALQQVAPGLGPGLSTRLSLPGYRGEELRLDPGPWIVRVEVPGYLPAALERSAGAEPGAAWRVVVTPQKVAVDLRFGPPRALRGARLQLRSRRPGVAGVIERAVDAPGMTLVLPAGPWQLDVVANRHEAHRELTVVPGMGPVDVTLNRRGRDAGDRRFERNEALLLALSGSALIFALAGAGVAIAGSAREGRVRRRNEDLLVDSLVDAASPTPSDPTGLARVEAEYSTASYHHDLRRAFRLETAGVTVIAAGLGALATGLPVSARTRRWAVWTELGVGVAATAGGAVWMSDAQRRERERLTRTAPDDRVGASDLRALAGSRAGASLLLGLGIGLVLFPAVALIVDRAQRKRQAQVSPLLGPGLTGLAVRGRF
jgi:hypothetical protein